MFKRWYVYETNSFFVNHLEAFHQIRGPFTKAQAHDIALWRMNQAMQSGEKTCITCISGARAEDISLVNRVNGVKTKIQKD